LESLGVAQQNYGDEGFTFINLVDFDIVTLKSEAKKRADKIKASGEIEGAIAAIQKQLRAGKILEN